MPRTRSRLSKNQAETSSSLVNLALVGLLAFVLFQLVNRPPRYIIQDPEVIVKEVVKEAVEEVVKQPMNKPKPPPPPKPTKREVQREKKAKVQNQKINFDYFFTLSHVSNEVKIRRTM